MTDIETRRNETVALAKSLMEDFGRKMEGWYERVHDDLVYELPYGESLGIFTKLEGAEAKDMLRQAHEDVKIQFFDIQIHAMADPDMVVVEQRSTGNPDGASYANRYVMFLRFKDKKLILFREYLNTYLAVGRTIAPPPQ